MTKLDSSAEKLILESKSRLEKRNTWLEHSIDDFKKELPKHESFPTSKDMLTSYIGTVSYTHLTLPTERIV